MDDLGRFGIVLGALLALTGCVDLSLGLGGDSTAGDRGRSRWSIDDGLCPGLAGDCALDVPLARGVRTTVEVRVGDRELEGLRVRGRGAVTASGFEIHRDDDPDGEDDYEPWAEVEVEAVGEGEGTLVLENRETGEEIDRVGLTVLSTAALECGTIPENQPVDWQMTTLVEDRSPTLRVVPVGESPELACRAVDAEGRPMLTVRAIEWEVLEGREHLGLLEDWLSEGLVRDRVEGARIHAHTISPGSATVRASLGDASAELAIEVVE